MILRVFKEVRDVLVRLFLLALWKGLNGVIFVPFDKFCHFFLLFLCFAIIFYVVNEAHDVPVHLCILVNFQCIEKYLYGQLLHIILDFVKAEILQELLHIEFKLFERASLILFKILVCFFELLREFLLESGYDLFFTARLSVIHSIIWMPRRVLALWVCVRFV